MAVIGIQAASPCLSVSSRVFPSIDGAVTSSGQGSGAVGNAQMSLVLRGDAGPGLGSPQWMKLGCFSGSQNSTRPTRFALSTHRRSIVAVLEVPKNPGWSSEEDDRKGSFIPSVIKSFTSSDASATSRVKVAVPLRGKYVSVEQRIFQEVVVEAAQKHMKAMALETIKLPSLSSEESAMLEDAYRRCGEVCGEYAKTFYLGTKLMTEERRRAIWAIYVWCRRTDELVDGPNASRITNEALDRWEQRLDDIFQGQPYDNLDAALAHSVKLYPVDMQPFRDMIDGMRMDMVKSRYANFDELFLYCYNVAGTVGIMSVPVMGIAPDSKVSVVSTYWTALALGIANQLTNILRDVGEDAGRGRVYLPQDELARFGLSDEDIFEGKVTDKWRAFMKFQIKRARDYFKEAEKGVQELDEHSRWPVWASLVLYRQILDSIELNDYDNFTKRAYVNKWQKMMCLPLAYMKARVGPVREGSENVQPVFLS